MPQSWLHDASAELDYTIDWSGWLAAGETISTSAWVAETGITIMPSPAPSNTTTTATVWLTGGTVGQGYNVTNTIVTSAGRKDERTIRVMVANR